MIILKILLVSMIFAFSAMMVVPVSAAQDVRKPFMSRADSFFGLHFDLHPNTDDKSLGADITEDMIDRLLDCVQLDFVQYDCKGHGGYTGYLTKVGYPCPGIVKDSLAIWRKVTREHVVGLFIHYSGLWDAVAVEKHPEWACVGADGKSDNIATSTFGPYVDKLMIPQLKEVTSAYGLDGVWVDGECWGAKFDYSPAALDAWKTETGLDKAPNGRNEPHWLEWKMFQRRLSVAKSLSEQFFLPTIQHFDRMLSAAELSKQYLCRQLV